MVLYLIVFSHYWGATLKSDMIYQKSQNYKVLKPDLKAGHLPHIIASSYLFICLWLLNIYMIYMSPSRRM